MPFDETLAARVTDALARKRNVEQKRMFGGIGFLLNGNLLVGVRKDTMLVRLGSDAAEKALLDPHVREFVIKGRGPMKGWVVVSIEGLEDDDQLKGWIDRATSFVKTLPAK